MNRNDLRHPYPAHTGNWRAAPPQRVKPAPKPLTFWHVLGGIAVMAVIIEALLSAVMAVVRGLGLMHG